MNVRWNDCEHEKPRETLKFHGHDKLKREAMIPENTVLADDLIIKLVCVIQIAKMDM